MNDDDTCDRNRLESIEQLGTYSSKAEVTPLMGEELKLTEWNVFFLGRTMISKVVTLVSMRFVSFFRNVNPETWGRLFNSLKPFKFITSSANLA